MSLIKCNECNHDISDKATVCPKCESRNEVKEIKSTVNSDKTSLIEMKKKYLLKLIILLVILFFSYILIIGVGKKNLKDEIRYQVNYGTMDEASILVDKYYGKYGSDDEVYNILMDGYNKEIDRLWKEVYR